MANEFELSPKELKRQADALLAAADAAEKAAEREPAARSAKKVHPEKGGGDGPGGPRRHDGRGGPEGRGTSGWTTSRWLRCPQPPG